MLGYERFGAGTKAPRAARRAAKPAAAYAAAGTDSRCGERAAPAESRGKRPPQEAPAHSRATRLERLGDRAFITSRYDKAMKFYERASSPRGRTRHARIGCVWS